MPDGAMLYEPGPLQPLDPSIFPQPGQLRPNIEGAVAPQSSALFEAADAQSANGSALNAAGEPNVDGEAATVLRPAFDELAYRASVEGQLSTSEAYGELGASIGELEGIASELPAEDSEYEEPEFPDEGKDTIPTSDNPGDLGIDVGGGGGNEPPLP